MYHSNEQSVNEAILQQHTGWPQRMALGVILTVVGYFLGSIPFGILTTRLLGKEDPRGKGSGNIGATNVLRSAGPMAALLTLMGDFLKGFAPTWTAICLGMNPLQTSIVGLASFLGHLFPVYLGFRGGKGVATGAGILAAISPETLLISLGAFGIICFTSRFVSLGSVMAALVAPQVMVLLREDPCYVLLCMILAAGILWKHRHNLRRILSGSEPKL